jgi:hypothetical protein
VRLLLLYYSFSGNNELLAKHLAARLACGAEAVVETKTRRPITILWDMILRRRPEIHRLRASAAAFDHVLFIAPLWNKGIAYPMVSAIRQARDDLRAYSFLTLCGSERPGQREHVVRELQKLTGKAPSHVWDLHVDDLASSDERGRAGTSELITADDLPAFRGVLDEVVAALTCHAPLP